MGKRFDPTQYKVAAFDLDGTLLNYGVLSERTRAALQRLAERGVTIAISTGRGPSIIPAALCALPCFSYVISANGACVTELPGGKLIAGTPIGPAEVARVVAIARRHRGTTNAFMQTRALFSWGYLPLVLKDASPGARVRLGTMFARPSRRVFCIARALERQREPVYKLESFFPSEADCAEACAELQKNGLLEAVTTRGDNLEITARGVTKAAGIRAVCEQIGVGTDAVVAFGDSRNDREMLLGAGYAVAMGNGDDAVIAIADYVAPHVAQDGAARAIEALFG